MEKWKLLKDCAPPVDKKVAVILCPEFAADCTDLAAMDKDGFWHGELNEWLPHEAVTEWLDVA